MDLLHRVCHRPNSGNQLGEWLQLPGITCVNCQSQGTAAIFDRPSCITMHHNAAMLMPCRGCIGGFLSNLLPWLDFLESFESLVGNMGIKRGSEALTSQMPSLAAAPARDPAMAPPTAPAKAPTGPSTAPASIDPPAPRLEGHRVT